jgi:CBS domain-containing protein
MKASQIMTADVKVIRPDSTVKAAAEQMRELNVGALPVCDGERLVGMLTDRDITIRAVAEGRNPETTRAADCMSPEILYCFEDDELDQAHRIMKQYQVRRLPVISRDKKLVGILAIGDLAIKTDETEKVGQTVEEISEVAPV